ncbi:MAG: 6-pyruvoyl-tetrahydropterin synthase-related protein [Patescibacteria group bacterium]
MKKVRYKKYLFFIGLIVLSFIPLFDLLHPGLPITHDGQDHVARIANFYQNLKEGNIIPRWAPNLNWGYGHPILMFLYPLPSYLASLFHFFGFSLVDSVKLVFGISFILSAVAMHLFTKELLNDEKAAFLASLLYVIAPYRFVDLYVRGAVGEHVAFIFPPLIFYFLLKLSKKFSKWYLLGGSLSLAGLILSHNAISLMFFPLFFLYIIYLVWGSKDRKYLILNTFYLILLGLGLSAFFFIPAFMEGKYTLRDIVTSGGEYKASFVIWKDFFYSTWSYGGTLAFSKQIGMMHWIGIFSSVIATYYLYKNKNKLWMVSLGGFLIFWITLFLMTSASATIWQSITLLQKFQFPWRFLSLTVFLSALLGAIGLQLFNGKHKTAFLLILTVALLLVNKDYWHANGFLQKQESFYSGIYNGTTDTGESAPIWSVRFMEKRAKANMEVIAGDARIRGIKRTSTSHKYKIIATERSRIRENTLYFPGWDVFVNGNKADVEFQDSLNRGLITFFVEKGENDVYIKFNETKLRLVADIITAATLAVVVSYLAFGLKKKYNPRDEKEK